MFIDKAPETTFTRPWFFEMPCAFFSLNNMSIVLYMQARMSNHSIASKTKSYGDEFYWALHFIPILWNCFITSTLSGLSKHNNVEITMKPA